MALVEGTRVRVAAQNSQFRKVTGVIVDVDETHYEDWKGNALNAEFASSGRVHVGDPFYVVQPDGASAVMTARFEASDLVEI